MGSAPIQFRRPQTNIFTASISPKKVAKHIESGIATTQQRAQEQWNAELQKRVENRLKNLSIPEMIIDYERTKMRLERVENRLDYLLHINDLDLNRFRDAPNNTLEKAFYMTQDIVDQDISSASYTEMRRWLEMMLHVSEVEYDRLVDILNLANPWKSFYAATYKVLNEIIDRRKINPDEESNITLRCAEKTRKHIINAANIFIRTRDLDGIGDMPVLEDLHEFLSDSWNRYIVKDLKNVHPQINKINERK